MSAETNSHHVAFICMCLHTDRGGRMQSICDLCAIIKGQNTAKVANFGKERL